MKKIVLFLTFMSVLSCTEKIEKPEKFLEKDEMINLLYDLSLASTARTFYTKDSILKGVGSDNVLAKYKLDSASFSELNKYYLQQPELYSEIFDTITLRLNKKIEEVEALPEDPRDTIGRIKVSDFSKFKIKKQ